MVRRNPDIFTPNAPVATVSVTDIESRLNAGTPVTIATSPAVSGDGDIYVNNAVSWSANALTLSSERDIKLNAVMTASGSSALLMNTATAVFGGTVKAGLSAGGFIGRVDSPSVPARASSPSTATVTPSSIVLARQAASPAPICRA